MSNCKHEDVRFEDVELRDDTCLKVKVRCERGSLIGYADVLSTQIEKSGDIEWDPVDFPMPESCEGCHCKNDMEFVHDIAAWVCRACGNEHHGPSGEGPPPHDAATATGRYDPEG